MKNFLLCTLAVLVTVNAFAKDDVSGSSDTDILGRIPGSYISTYYTSDYAELSLPLSANSDQDETQFERLDVAGAQQLVIYTVPEAVTNSVARAYQSIYQAATDKGIHLLFSCRSWKDECGRFLPRQVLHTGRPKSITNLYRYGLGNSYNYGPGAADYGFVIGEISKNQKKHYLLCLLGRSKWDNEIQYAYEVITAEEMKLITLSETQMREDIAAQGSVVLSGLYFDNGKATLRADSQAALQTIAGYILANPRRYLVVGHTDYNGSFASNQVLSEQRSKSVIAALTSSYKVPENLLTPIGVAYAAPKTSNQTEDGRAKNRRVELVLEAAGNK
ncbi:outer membrane protein OmpA-like peptidoglycan-associated protein [Alteromonadaceae bacterium 2753L.S.0a.02]|nr:outer membrane protein OmpA-like peptidoglycan-associated protein [Alteromonadaceae bacterium 2753L.S.0a.02]